jgi:hypothetical protein
MLEARPPRDHVESLEGIPGAIRDVSTNSVDKSAYVGAWRAC